MLQLIKSLVLLSDHCLTYLEHGWKQFTSKLPVLVLVETDNHGSRFWHRTTHSEGDGCNYDQLTHWIHQIRCIWEGTKEFTSNFQILVTAGTTQCLNLHRVFFNTIPLISDGSSSSSAQLTHWTHHIRCIWKGPKEFTWNLQVFVSAGTE